MPKKTDTPRELPEYLRRKLFEAARKARRRAYAPRSKFRVGAAVLTRQGKIFGGGNIEVGMNELGLCAERTALYKAVSEGFRKIRAVAVVSDDPSPISPCGVCREALYKFASTSRMPVYMLPAKGKAWEVRSIAELLPLERKRSRER